MTDHVDHASPRAPKRGFRKKIIVGAALAGVASVAGLAFAEWLATGSGSGYAKSGTVVPLSTQSVTVAATLYPGSTGDLVIRIHNPNPFNVTLTSVMPNGPITSSDPACDAAGHGVTFEGVTGLGNVIDASAIGDVTLSDAVSMASTSANECQGDIFTVPVVLSSVSGGFGGGGFLTWYYDVDRDGHGTPENAIQSGTPPLGYVDISDDCNDFDVSIFPGASELPDGKDNDCDGTTDEDIDQDDDSYMFAGGDCDDSNPAVHPNAEEVFDFVDNDCDTLIDEGVVIPPEFLDVDGDGYTPLMGDCDDQNFESSPGATEVFDGIDNDCDALVDGEDPSAVGGP